MTEVRTTSATGGEKGTKDERFSLLPTGALASVARHYGIGARKYAEHNWARGYEWSKSYDAMQRHANAFWGGEDIDAETGSPHMAAVAFHALTLLTFMDEHPDFDDRYKAATEGEAERESFTPKPGTVFHSAPQIDGFYHDCDGDTWERRDGRWALRKYARSMVISEFAPDNWEQYQEYGPWTAIAKPEGM